MASITETIPSLEEFERAAQEYAATLTIEDKMESTDQSTQIHITHTSLELVTRRWPQCQCLDDLLIQYLLDGEITRVCPDNYILLSDTKIENRGTGSTEAGASLTLGRSATPAAASSMGALDSIGT